MASRFTSLFLVKPERNLRGENALDALIEALAGDAAIFHGGQHSADGLFRIGRHQQHVGARDDRPHRAFAAIEQHRQALHGHGIGDDQALELELVAQQPGEHVVRYGGGQAGGLEGRDGDVRGHDGVHAVRDGGLERLQLRGVEALARHFQTRQAQVAIDIGIAVPGKMFGGDQDTIRRVGMRAFDKCGDVARYLLGIFAVGAQVDDRVQGIVVDVGHRREDPVNAQGASLAGGDHAFILHGGEIARRSERHAVRESRAAGDAHGSGSLEIGGHQQRGPGQLLHLVQEQGHGMRLGVADQAVLRGVVDDDAAHVQIGDPVAVFFVILRLAAVDVAIGGDDHQLRDFIVQAHAPHQGLRGPLIRGER